MKGSGNTPSYLIRKKKDVYANLQSTKLHNNMEVWNNELKETSLNVQRNPRRPGATTSICQARPAEK